MDPSNLAATQGALGLLAVPEVRRQLERAGLDWQTLCAVAAGQLMEQKEVGS